MQLSAKSVFTFTLKLPDSEVQVRAESEPVTTKSKQIEFVLFSFTVKAYTCNVVLDQMFFHLLITCIRQCLPGPTCTIFKYCCL